MTIDDQLLQELRERADAEKTTINELAERALRECIKMPPRATPMAAPRSMGAPLIDLNNAWEVIAKLETDEYLERTTASE